MTFWIHMVFFVFSRLVFRFNLTQKFKITFEFLVNKILGKFTKNSQFESSVDVSVQSIKVTH